MEAQREESDSVGDCRAPMEETGKELGLASETETETLDGEVNVPLKESCIEDANAAEVSDLSVCDVSGTVGNPNDGVSVSDEERVRVDVASVKDSVGSVSEDNVDKAISSDEVEKTDTFADTKTDDGAVEVKPVNSEIHESGGKEETVISAGDKVTDDKANCEVEDSHGDGDDSDATTSDTEQNEKPHQSSVGGETLSIAEDKADQEKDSANKIGEDNKMAVDSKQANQENVESETNDTTQSEYVQVPEVSSSAEICREEEEELTNVNQKEENGEAMEIDPLAEEQVEKDVLDNAGNESTGASMIQTQDVPIAEADRNESNVVEEMEIDERKDNADMTSDLTAKTESAYSANPNSSTEDAAPGEVEPLDDNALFDPRSDITNFIDFSGVSCWSGNIQDLKTDTGNVSLKEDKKATDMAEEVATEDCNEALKSVDATVNAESRDKLCSSAEGVENESNEALVATECQKEASDAIMGSEENQEDKDHHCSDEKAVDQQDTPKKEDGTTDEAPSIDPNQKEDTVMEENPNNSDYADVGTDSDTKTNGVKRKADVLSEDLLGESRKTVSLAKVSFAQRPSFKIGACIARAASQMAGSPSVLKGSNVGDEPLSVESFVSQLHSAATEPVKENVVSEIAADFFLDFRNSSAAQQYTPETLSSKKGRPSNSNAGGTEAFEFEEMGDTYWTDRVIHNGGEEQMPPTDKENYQVVPVELKPAQVKRTRRPYRRRQSQIISPLPSVSDKPADFDENAPAELIMNFSETDTIPPEKSLSKMFRHFGPIRDSQTEVDLEKHRARVVFRKVADAEAAYNSVGRFNIFGTKAVNYELSFTITETFKVQPYVVSLGEEEAAHFVPSST